MNSSLVLTVWKFPPLLNNHQPTNQHRTMNTESEHLISVVVRYKGPTDCRGSRTILSLPRFNNKKVTLSYGYEFTSSREQAENWLTSEGITGIRVTACLDMGDYWILGIPFECVDALKSAFKL